MSEQNIQSQVPVKWAVGLHLEDTQTSICQIPVVPLSALREVVEGLKERYRGEACFVYAEAFIDLLASLGEVGK